MIAAAAVDRVGAGVGIAARRLDSGSSRRSAGRGRIHRHRLRADGANRRSASPNEFAATRRGAYLLNVSRGKIVQEAALLAALADGARSGAYLDAHAQEPLPNDRALWDAPGVTIVPHDSHSSPYTGDNVVELFAGNLRCYLAGEPLRNSVERNCGY